MDIWADRYKDLEKMEKRLGIKIDLGCGYKKRKEYIGVDILKSSNVDVISSVEKLPFKDNSVDLIYSRHVLEHVSSHIDALNEIYRVLKSGGIFYMVVPHGMSYSAIYMDHKRFFNIFSMDLLDVNSGGKTFDIEGMKVKFKILRRKYRYTYMSNPLKRMFFKLIMFFANNHYDIFERNLAHIFPPYEIEFILQKV